MKKGDLTIRDLYLKNGKDIEGLETAIRLGDIDTEDESKFPKLTTYDSIRRIDQKGAYFFTNPEDAKKHSRKKKILKSKIKRCKCKK